MKKYKKVIQKLQIQNISPNMERKNRITYKIKTGYYLDLLTRETNRLPGSTKIKVVKDENSKNAPDLLSVKSVRIRSYSGPYLI